MNKKVHIIFDFNGVIIDDEKIHYKATQEVLKKSFNKYLSEDLYYKYFIGKTNEKAFFDYFVALNINADINEVCKLKSLIYMEFVQQENVTIQATVNFIKNYSSIYNFSIVSGANKNEILYHLKCLGIDNLFLNIIASEDITESKPSPEGYLKAISLSAIPVEQTIIVEDSLSGVKAAKAAKAYCIALTTTHTKEELVLADLVVNELSINSIKY